MPGDDVVPRADAVMDRGFTVGARPEAVWPWLVQLGKGRAGWYFPRRVEHFIPRKRRGIRHIDPRWQGLAVGEVIPDYGGSDATFDVHLLEPSALLVYTSSRGSVDVSWAIRLTPVGDSGTRVHLRLRLGPLKRPWLANTFGDWFDLLTIAGMAAGLEERLADRWLGIS